MKKRNLKVRAEMRIQNVPVWALAEKEHVSENTMFRRLRCELPADEQERLIQLIREIAKE